MNLGIFDLLKEKNNYTAACKYIFLVLKIRSDTRKSDLTDKLFHLFPLILPLLLYILLLFRIIAIVHDFAKCL